MSEKQEAEQERRIDGYRLATESLKEHARTMDEARRAAAERDARESAACYDPTHDALEADLRAARVLNSSLKAQLAGFREGVRLGMEYTRRELRDTQQRAVLADEMVKVLTWLDDEVGEQTYPESVIKQARELIARYDALSRDTGSEEVKS